jgi:drug/metabolite transporter (DMT)-like permease
VTAVISWIFAFIMETPSIDQIRSAAIPILYCGLVSGGIGFTLQLVAQKYSDPTVASLLMSLESVFAAIGGAVILHERMSARELIGCIIMFSAIIIVQIPVKGKKRSPGC